MTLSLVSLNGVQETYWHISFVSVIPQHLSIKEMLTVKHHIDFDVIMANKLWFNNIKIIVILYSHADSDSLVWSRFWCTNIVYVVIQEY